eukprot:730302-Pleurochrysis_carterae.AAC.1
MKPVIQHIISPQQLGFVPGKRIDDASLLVKLIQAYTDKTNDEGLLIAIDFAKAFDRVSWTYLENAIKALGFGPKFADMILLTINEAVPPLRKVKINGSLGVEFPLQSGVAQ